LAAVAAELGAEEQCAADTYTDGREAAGLIYDVTAIPQLLDARLEALDSCSAVRPTTIKPGHSWYLRL